MSCKRWAWSFPVGEHKASPVWPGVASWRFGSSDSPTSLKIWFSSTRQRIYLSRVSWHQLMRPVCKTECSLIILIEDYEDMYRTCPVHWHAHIGKTRTPCPGGQICTKGQLLAGDCLVSMESEQGGLLEIISCVVQLDKGCARQGRVGEWECQGPVA